jgi:hypothetical protein
MKAVIFAVSVAAIAATAPLNAQVLGGRPTLPSTSRGTTVNGSWQAIGQDRNGTIYERRTYDGNGNIVIQRARRDANGNFSIIDTRTVRSNDNNGDCQLSGNNTTVGGIVLGRSGNTNCTYDRRSADGVWRQVGQGRNNNSVYERRTYDRNGNIVVQKARRNPNGSFRIISSRTIRNNHSDNDRYDNNYGYNNGDYRYDSNDARYNDSEHKKHGKGKGHKGRD